MPLSRWDNIPKVMDVRLNQVPYVVLCQLNSFKTNKVGTHPLVGYSRDISVEWQGSIAKISGVITTEYEQMVPFIINGIRKDDNTMRHRVLVPIFDYDTWSLALGSPNPDTQFEFNNFWSIVTSSSTLVFSKVTT